jgi:sulfonate transport system substrate-binding protein
MADSENRCRFEEERIMNYRRGLLVVGATVAIATACSPTASPSSPAASAGASASPGASVAESKSVVLVTGIDAVFSHFVVAANQGFFEGYNIDAEFKPFDDGNVAMDAVLTGDGDVAGGSEFGGLTRRANGGALYVVGYGARSGRNTAVVVRDDVSSPKDLEGKKIGFPQASGAHQFFLRYVSKHGLDASTIEVVNVQAPESVAALRNGDIDALFLWEPWPTRALEEIPGTKVLTRSGEDDVWYLTHYIYFGQRLLDDTELGGNVLRAFIDAQAWMKSNPDDAAEIVGEAFNIEPELAKTQMALYDYDVQFTPQIRSDMEEWAGVLKELGRINEVPNLDDYLHPEVLESVDPQRVESP